MGWQWSKIMPTSYPLDEGEKRALFGSLEKEVREGSAPLAWRQLHVPPQPRIYSTSPRLALLITYPCVGYTLSIAILSEPLGLLLTGFIVRIPFIYLVIKRWKESQA